MLGQDEQLQEYQDRFRYLYLILILATSVLVIRLWYLQAIQGDEFQRISEENRLRKIVQPAPRGMIFDRNRRLLTDNQPTFDVVITPQYFNSAKPEERAACLAKLARLLNIPVQQIQGVLEKNKRQPSFQPIVVKSNLTQDEVALIEMERIDLPGVDVDVGIRRTNVNDDIGSHLMGYIAPISPEELPKLNELGRKYQKGDTIGKFGLEQYLEETLRGVDGVEYLEVDAFGRRKITAASGQGDRTSELLAGLENRAPVPGKNLILTVDLDLQLAAANAFKSQGKTGSVVAIDPSNGEVLAMLSWPSFNSSEFSTGIRADYWKELREDEDKPMRDKAVQDHYSPGSTFKIISTIAGLEEGLINRHTVIQAGGSFRFGGRNYHEWKRGGFGRTDPVKALANSVDVFFYKLATRMDIDTLAKWARALGLGERTGISLPGEAPGIVPDRAWKLKRQGKEWFPGETLSVIIGQGALNATPIQLANMIGAIANGGTIYKPRVVKYVESPDGEVLETTKPEILRQTTFKPGTLDIVQRGLRGVFNHDQQGTARWAAIPGIEAAGKSGTVQLIRFSADKVYTKCQSLEKKYRHHGLFVAYAPVDDPKIAVAVVAEHSCSGSAGAAPIAMEVIKAYLGKLMPDKYGEEALKLAKEKFWKGRARSAEQQRRDEEEAENEGLSRESQGDGGDDDAE